jgi:transcriptional regulator with XRE-family HTH domain
VSPSSEKGPKVVDAQWSEAVCPPANGGNGHDVQPDPNGGPPRQHYHRVRTVRRQQGMSLRTAARRLGTSIGEARALEDETEDLRLSDLHRWQAALDVPLTELLADPDTPLSQPVRERAQMVRVMKSAAALLEMAPTPQLQRLAQNLVEQLITLMPELRGVGAWHSVGQRRGLEEYGAIMDRRMPDELLRSSLDKED